MPDRRAELAAITTSEEFAALEQVALDDLLAKGGSYRIIEPATYHPFVEYGDAYRDGFRTVADCFTMASARVDSAGNPFPGETLAAPELRLCRGVRGARRPVVGVGELLRPLDLLVGVTTPSALADGSSQADAADAGDTVHAVDARHARDAASAANTRERRHTRPDPDAQDREQAPGDGDAPRRGGAPGDGDAPGCRDAAGDGDAPGGRDAAGDGDAPGRCGTAGDGDAPACRRAAGDGDTPGSLTLLPAVGTTPITSTGVAALPRHGRSLAGRRPRARSVLGC